MSKMLLDVTAIVFVLSQSFRGGQQRLVFKVTLAKTLIER